MRLARARRRAPFVAAIALASTIVWAPVTSEGHSGNGWTFDIELTDTDGLAVTRGIFQGKWVFARVSIPQIRVDYAYHPTMNDQLGRRGIANVPFVTGSTKLTRTSSYISVTSSFRCCSWPSAGSYRYDVRYTFYSTGAFRPAVYVYGPGLERKATYNVFFRMDFNVNGSAYDRVKRYGSGSWAYTNLESPLRDDGIHTGGEEWAIVDDAAKLGYFVEPRPTDGRPTMYVLRYHTGQGNQDLGTAVRLPSHYDNNETVDKHSIVEWYMTYTSYTRPSGCPRSCYPPRIAGPVIYRKVEPLPSPTPTVSPSPTGSETPSPSPSP